jgi:hypothetical protein
VLDEEGIGVGLEDEVLHEGLGYIVISLNRKSNLINMSSSIQCCGFGMFIPEPNFFHPGSRNQFFQSRIRIKEFKYFNKKMVL